MERRTFLQIPGTLLALWPMAAGTAELAVAHLHIEGMT